MIAVGIGDRIPPQSPVPQIWQSPELADVFEPDGPERVENRDDMAKRWRIRQTFVIVTEGLAGAVVPCAMEFRGRGLFAQDLLELRIASEMISIARCTSQRICQLASDCTTATYTEVIASTRSMASNDIMNHVTNLASGHKKTAGLGRVVQFRALSMRMKDRRGSLRSTGSLSSSLDDILF